MTSSEQNSYRSELCVILENMLVITAICELHGITEPCQVLVGCNNKLALWKGLGPTPVHMKMASTDIVKAIQHLRSLTLIQWKAH